MLDLIDQIKKLESLVGYTKHERIVEGISNSIEESVLKQGDSLPSINQLSGELGCARETIVKAYSALRERGIVNSKHGLGYFISNDDLNQKMHLALVLYGFQTFQQTFYNSLRKSLGAKYKIDVFFHHNNMDMYKSILQNIRSKYGMYVIAPIQSPEAEEFLSIFPHKKLLIVDRYQYLSDEVAHITQEFELTLSNVFEELRDRIKAFSHVVFYFRESSDYPIGVKNAFLKFCESDGLSFEMYEEYDTTHLATDTVYFTIGDSDLWPLIKDAKEANLDIGTDIGILSHNDSPVKEIIEGGITTFSTDFELMAKRSAEYIKTKEMIKEIIPIRLIIRNSL